MSAALPGFALHAYAIVSDDDRIADAAGRFPEALRSEADWQLFQRELDTSVLTILGRATHVAAPNVKGRRRLILSRGAARLEERSDGLWWNPAQASLAEALAAAGLAGGKIAVVGGRDVYDTIGIPALDAFHLTRAIGTTLPGGRGCYALCERGEPLEALLAAGGLKPGEPVWLDEARRMRHCLWRR